MEERVLSTVGYGERVASVVRVHLVANLDYKRSAAPMLVSYLDLAPSVANRRLEGYEPWSVWDLFRLAALFGMHAADLLREAENRPPGVPA